MTKILLDTPQDLAQAKNRGQNWDILERKYLPEFSKDLYLVLGYTGRHELGTYRAWLVRAFRDSLTAEHYALACSKHATEWERTRDSYTHSPPFGWSQLDPGMLMSYEGSYYRVLPVPIEMRPEELQSREDTCSICGAQLHQTSFGMICDRGHEL